LRSGDALERNGYFDRALELELIRHLRNGIAQGNRFDIRDPNKLTKFPTHNRNCYRHEIFEITRRSMDSLSSSISWERATCSTFCSVLADNFGLWRQGARARRTLYCASG
jgi:hypothetical protein